MSAFTIEKIAVFAPIERARVMMTVAVKPGSRRTWRAASLMFCPRASIGGLLDETGEVLRSLAKKYHMPAIGGWTL